MDDLKTQSPLGKYLEHCGKGELAYQVCAEDGAPVFYPRVVAPKSASPDLTWRVSRGLGKVYATTVVFAKDQPPRNVALIDVDEGFRMMSRVEDIDPMQVRIEAVRQVRGECSQRQVKDCEIALAHGNGAVLSSECTVLFGGASTV